MFASLKRSMCKERSERRYIHAARNDSLTGIANRSALLENAQRVLRRCQSDGVSFSVILFDLDRFKRVNDTFGHDVGDNVLRKFAKYFVQLKLVQLQVVW